MIFGNIQKLTLLDYPEKTACTLFSLGCNFRCPFCHNAALVRGDAAARGIDVAARGIDEAARSIDAAARGIDAAARGIDAAEAIGFLKTRRGLLDGVCVSGGEPLMRSALSDFMREVKALGFLVKLDTNGSYPDRLKELLRSGAVDYVAMDIKNTPEKYAATIGIAGYDSAPIAESMDILLSGAVLYEFRTTVVRELHTGEDLISIARRIAKAERYYLQGFIDSGDTLQGGLHGYTDPEMRELLHQVKTVMPKAELRGV